MITPRKQLEIIMAWAEDQKWYKDAVKEADAVQAFRNERLQKLIAREPEWNFGPIKNRQIQRQKVLDDIISKEA